MTKQAIQRKSAASRPGAPSLLSRIRLRYVLFLLLLLSGIAPLLISSLRLIDYNKDILKRQEMFLLTHSARSLADALSDDLAQRHEQLRQIGLGLSAVPGFDSFEERLREPWVNAFLLDFMRDHPEIVDLRVIDAQGNGLRLGNSQLPQPVMTTVQQTLEAVLNDGTSLYRFVGLAENSPGVAIAVSIPIPNSSGQLIVQALMEAPLRFLAERSEVVLEELFLIDHEGKMLWSIGAQPEIERALIASDLVQDFRTMPFSVTGEYDLEIGDAVLPTLARVVPVLETGWGVIAHKPAEKAYPEVEEMVYNTGLWSMALVLLALVVALISTRWLSQPIQNLAEASHEIAAGNFDRRVDTKAMMVTEITDLANDFNRMSDYVENYIEQLRRAVQLNKELFISSIRAFAAAIDAKDPYTRGHSERVAAYSRAIARYLGLPKDVQERVWISAVLHDVGKIGVDDRVLKKGDVLTPEEFDMMKLHPVIGADIVEPISELREMLPGIRWHHEAWNGSGYPDSLKGEEIPLMARIIGVADTFDAITTSRPYQKASSPDYAIQIIRKLTGSKFDPKITTAFLLAWESGQIAMERAQADTASAEMQPGANAQLRAVGT